MSWDSDPSDFTDEVEDGVKEQKAKVALYVLSGVVQQSPVDTGRFRGNNQVTNSSITTTYSYETKDKEGGNASLKGAMEIARSKPFETIYIQNNLPYGGKLEAGFSPQAPGGIYKLSYENAKRKFDL